MTAPNSQHRSYVLHFEDKPGYLLAKVSGEIDTFEVALQYWLEILEEVDKRKPSKLMVWEDSEKMVSTMDLARLVKELTNYKQFKDLRVVFVDEHKEQYSRNILGELIANNQGFNSRVCADHIEGERWLLKGKPVHKIQQKNEF